MAIIDDLEKYLKQEGLSSQIPPWRIDSVFPVPFRIPYGAWFFIWLAVVWAGVIYLTHDVISFWAGILFCIVSSLTFYSCVVMVVGTIIKLRGEEAVNNSVIGYFMFIGYSVIVISSMWFISGDWRKGLAALLISVGAFIFLIIQGKINIVVVLHNFRTILFTIGKSISTLILIIPLLLVIIIVSVFSQDIWIILARITWTSYLSVLLLLFIPPFLLTLARSRHESESLVGEYPDMRDIVALFKNSDYYSSRIARRYISPEEVDRVISDLTWRHIGPIHKDFSRWAVKTVNNRLFYYLEGISVLLLVVFFLFFVVLYSNLIYPETIANWVGVPLRWNVYDFGFLKNSISLPSTNEILFRVSLMLAVIVSITARVSMFSDKDFKSNTLAWLIEKSREWMAISAIYKCQFDPGYQFLKYEVDTENECIVNIIVPQGTPIEEIEDACQDQCREVYFQGRDVYVIASESEKNRPDYSFVLTGRKWKLSSPYTDAESHFSECIDPEPVKIHLQHQLGKEYLAQGENIPDEWFGDSEKAVDISKAIWTWNLENENFLQPYTKTRPEESGYECTIFVNTRKDTSHQYKAFLREIITGLDLSGSYITIISVQIIGTKEELARWIYYEDTDRVTYKDEKLKKSVSSALADWERG